MTYVTAWSFSAWDMWRTCPLQYKLAKIDKLKTETSPAMLRGREVHDAIAKYLSGEHDRLGVNIASKRATKLYDEIRAFDNKVVEQQWGFDRRWSPTGWFAKGPKATWLRAVIDVGVLYDDMSAEVIDHKTGKNRGGYDDQLELFAVAAMQHLPAINHVTTRLSFVDHEETAFGEYPRSDVSALIEKWEGKVRPMFEDTEFLPRPNAKCKFCDFSRANGGPCKYGG